MRSRSRYEVSVVTPYRLDLTVSVLRRLSTNVVDLLTPDGYYVRALGGANGPVLVHVAEVHPDTLAVTIEADLNDHAWALAVVRRMLGVERDLTHFEQAAARVSWLGPLALRMRGVKPPRYPSLWEAFVNAITFQQVSLHAASAIARRLIITLGRPLERDGVTLYAFPSAELVLGAADRELRVVGLSAAKLATLRRAGEALASGALGTAMLDEHPSVEAAALLRQVKGIGPWTAAVILLRGLGRLDVFPMRDTSIARNLALVADPVPRDIANVLLALQPQQGMLYYYLLLARLEARGQLGRASESARARRGAGRQPKVITSDE